MLNEQNKRVNKKLVGKNEHWFFYRYRAGNRVRTDGLQLGKLTLCQLSYTRLSEYKNKTFFYYCFVEDALFLKKLSGSILNSNL